MYSLSLRIDSVVQNLQSSHDDIYDDSDLIEIYDVAPSCRRREVLSYVCSCVRASFNRLFSSRFMMKEVRRDCMLLITRHPLYHSPFNRLLMLCLASEPRVRSLPTPAKGSTWTGVKVSVRVLIGHVIPHIIASKRDSSGPCMHTVLET